MKDLEILEQQSYYETKRAYNSIVSHAYTSDFNLRKSQRARGTQESIVLLSYLLSLVKYINLIGFNFTPGWLLA